MRGAGAAGVAGDADIFTDSLSPGSLPPRFFFFLFFFFFSSLSRRGSGLYRGGCPTDTLPVDPRLVLGFFGINVVFVLGLGGRFEGLEVGEEVLRERLSGSVVSGEGEGERLEESLA